ncbi:endolytic transglycosylase MltG [Paenibacillus turpanensis]|uniref:endolytic transglycosylase MltG n=1 Tax=Paenibacillus turpanensis TaxID=2689078 RepID=UPI00140982FD|nr:endolytic transglycosylase MltG [Paenibacillus turpanensis]
MSDKKRFLYGLGWGIIGTALIMQLLTFAQEGPGKTLPPQPGEAAQDTVEVVKEKASAHGYELVKKGEKLYTQEEVAKLQQTAAEEAAKKAAAEQQQEMKTALIITEQSSATSIADALTKLGLVSSRNQFLTALAEQQLNQKLQIGTYVFVGKPELAEIITRITIKP